MKKSSVTFRDYLIDRFGSVYAFAKQCEEHNVGISTPYVYKLAAGEYSNITIKMLTALSQELELAPSELLELFGIDSDSIM